MEPHVEFTAADFPSIEAEARRLRAVYFRGLMISAGRALARLVARRAPGRTAHRTA